MYTIGQVSKNTNVTVSTLRYYDEIGLLKPAKIADSGYRYYSNKELIILQHIISLKELGFSLSIIKTLLESEENKKEHTLKSYYEIELKSIEKERQRLDRLEKLLLTAKNALEMTGKVEPKDIFLFIQAIQSPPEIREAFLSQHFSEREIRIIKNLPDISSDDPRVHKWTQMIRKAKEHMHEAPASKTSQHLAKQFVEISMEWFEQDEKLIEKYWTLIRPQEGMEAKVYGLDNRVMDYIDKIVDLYLIHLQEEKNTNGEENKND
ncbi:MerR family transcriptional regulator [Cytobacillus praedii]|uniref:MerR family transcriptional regulator n=1 Tax=Cytobacillus praedii TaxID=1742358 RepID=UPI003F80B1A5